MLPDLKASRPCIFTEVRQSGVSNIRQMGFNGDLRFSSEISTLGSSYPHDPGRPCHRKRSLTVHVHNTNSELLNIISPTPLEVIFFYTLLSWSP